MSETRRDEIDRELREIDDQIETARAEKPQSSQRTIDELRKERIQLSHERVWS